ncbi:hypothetical protein [Bradyrhizobium sp. HKCCYLR20261]|uniref:hypothetical protein n=1 Tax=Bradyrhizobium sp. HKCCYLR20261 TaxID=3420760 RepID=UPI003EBA3FDE
MSSAASLRHEQMHSPELAAAKRVVISGSVAFMSQMRQIKNEFDRLGVRSVMPDDIDAGFNVLDKRSYMSFKKGISTSHINKIKHPLTYGVLVANFDKNGVHGYIGANTFAEVSVAFSSRKHIFLLGEIPRQYSDELTAWGAISLHGDLSQLVKMYEASCRHETAQLRFPQF